MALESTARETYEYETQPAMVAEACQNVLKRIGKVDKVSRGTGTITGKINTGFFGRGNPHLPGMRYASVTLRISRKGENTELSIQTTAVEGIATHHWAQRAMKLFIDAIGQEQSLTGKATGGW
jgi:hypothetical protein